MAPVEARASLRLWLVTGEPPRPDGDAEAGVLVAAAAEQGLSGLLHSDVVSQGVAWPQSAMATLRDRHRQAAVRGIRQLDAAARVQRLLGQRGLRSLPLKGAAVVEQLYDGAGDRPMADVDILALDDWQASTDVLRQAGFAESEAADHARSFEDPVSGTIVELHHSVTSCPGLFPMDADGLWSRSRPADGQVSRLPSVEDLLVQLSLHAAFQHGLVLTLVQFLDFRRLLERVPLDVEALLARARHAGALGAVAASVRAAEAVVALPLAARLNDALAAFVPRGLRRHLERARREPLRLVAPAVPSLAWTRWALASGRRRALVTRTVAPREPGKPRRLHRAVVRAGTLAWRWGPLANRA